MDLVKAGIAKVESLWPVLTVRLIGIETVCRVLIPQDCRTFRHEVIISCEKARSHRPMGATSGEYLETQRLMGDQYRPSSHKNRNWDDY